MSGILSYPTLTGEAFSLTSALQWLDYLMAALDVYTWVFESFWDRSLRLEAADHLVFTAVSVGSNSAGFK